MKGRELQRSIIDTARRLGWRVAHTPPIETTRGWRTGVSADGKGFPDLLMVRDRVMVAEIKGDGDRLSPEQETWLSAFRLAGVEAYVWTSTLWREGEIELALRRRSPLEELIEELTPTVDEWRPETPTLFPRGRRA